MKKTAQTLEFGIEKGKTALQNAVKIVRKEPNLTSVGDLAVLQVPPESFNNIEKLSKATSKCIKKHNLNLLYFINSDKIMNVDSSLGNLLRDCVSKELIMYGFNHNDEANQYRIKLEKLIDEMGKLYL